MSAPLWQWDELVAAAEGSASGPPSRAVTGFSIDSRSLAPGDVFVALKDQRDGHEFVAAALAKGAAAALVRRGYALPGATAPLIEVADPLAALTAVARRARLRTPARMVAVTGSVGKTGTKEALRRALAAVGRVHASEKSYNNQWGVPLTLARMPAATELGVLEIGMNHAGEITPLSRLVRPHVALITTVEPVHLEFFASVAAIADAKAEIFAGLEPDGVAVLNRDNAHFDRLRAAAVRHGARVVSFGADAAADVRLVAVEPADGGSRVTAAVAGKTVSYRVGAPGRHIALNTGGVLAVLSVLGVDLARALAPLACIAAPVGRGERTLLAAAGGRVLLIDESYNANPASVRAALAALAEVPRAEFGRRVVVLGDMRELGPAAARLHADLEPAVIAAGADVVLACGPLMRPLFDALPAALQGAWSETSAGLEAPLLAAVRAGDAVMIKGSLGTRMGPLVAALKRALAPQA